VPFTTGSQEIIVICEQFLNERFTTTNTKDFMSEKARSRPHIALTNPSPTRCPAYPCNWVLYDRDKGEVMITVVREWERGPHLRLERLERSKPA
jgi:hypothetical protein